ncbi:MAG: WXG100 family type VII secretion target [Anaerolineae bacterium]|nr:WXG100 family type VII secretion target [Anaerolineae bacterium]
MAANVIQADYDVLEKVGKEFEKLHSLNLNMTRQIRTYSQTLVQDGWKGEAAEQFEQEMESVVLPRLDRYCEALEMAAQVTQMVSSIMQEAEQQACSLFK